MSRANSEAPVAARPLQPRHDGPPDQFITEAEGADGARPLKTPKGTANCGECGENPWALRKGDPTSGNFVTLLV